MAIKVIVSEKVKDSEAVGVVAYVSFNDERGLACWPPGDAPGWFYPETSLTDYAALLRAKSKGKYLNKEMKDREWVTLKGEKKPKA